MTSGGSMATTCPMPLAIDNGGKRATLLWLSSSAMCLKGIATMKQDLVRKWLVIGMLVGLQALLASAQDGQTGASSPSESATPQMPNRPSMKPAIVKAGQNEPSEPRATSPTQPQTGVDEILKMLQAGVSKEVMKAYIETAQVASPLSAADIVTLKEHSLSDDLTVALIKRGAELTAQVNQAGASNAAPAKVSGTTSLEALVAALRSSQFNAGRLDPEGYDYFRYYYLYPRTLASANERLFSSPSSPAFPSYASGYYPPWGFRPRPFAPQFPGLW
jgi:hypothetical protein